MKFLLEYNEYKNSTRSKELSKEDFLELLSNNCTQYSFDNTQIYRGVRSGRSIYSDRGGKGDFLYMNPVGKKRLSIENENIHTFCMDNLPVWKEYPKRSESLIGITSLEGSKMYGEVYVVIPFDNSKIGVCPSYSIWSSFGERIASAFYFFKSLEKSLKLPNGYFDFTEDDISNEEFKNKLVSISDDLKSYIETLYNPEYPGSFFIKSTMDFRLLVDYGAYKEYGTIKDASHKDRNKIGKHLEDISGLEIYNFLNDYYFNPDKQRLNRNTYDIDFRIINYKENFKIEPVQKSGYAIWTEGPVLMINYIDWKDIQPEIFNALN